ncbi:HET domain-containing protein [Candidatus Bathyarchaeota archaeon]|nr:HET domain-containing protein [Candidatus Bathyarchaeota archaeon]
MRLLNATTLRLETSNPGTEPPYAILSHRWTDSEILFDDIENGTAHTKRGFAKLRGCCDVALREGLTHVWIDTCCIDKSSSAELAEEINSMFRWYSRAKICYAYLHDATGDQDYLDSEWFDRGWTLQELIAPGTVDFYAGDWTKFGSRSILSQSLSAKTGIAKEYLHGADLRGASIAERMSWAAGRKTARPEDTAYCLLGIFNIHMAPIYGEGGEKAFVRLQRELLDQSDDHSYLAWTVLPGDQTAPATTDSLSSLLARSPAAFKNCGDVVCCDRDATATITPVSMTNVGIHARLPVVQKGAEKLLLLRCRWRQDYWNIIAVPVAERIGRAYRTSMETRTCPEEDWPEGGAPHDMLLSPYPYERATDLVYAVKPLPPGFRVIEVLPDEAWERHLDTHIRIKSESTPGSLTRRLVRLEHKTATDQDQDPNDYVLKLDLGSPNGGNRHPVCQMGILPRGCPLSQSDEDTARFGTAISLRGKSAALVALLRTRPLHGTDSYVVDVFLDETRRRRIAPRSRVLFRLLSEIEDEEERQTDEADIKLDGELKLEATGIMCLQLFLFLWLVINLLETRWVSVAVNIVFISLAFIVMGMIMPRLAAHKEDKQRRERLITRNQRRERLRNRGYMTFQTDNI